MFEEILHAIQARVSTPRVHPVRVAPAPSRVRPGSTLGQISWSVPFKGQGPPSDKLDAIFVLGGGQTEDAGVPEWVVRRLDAAYDLHQRQRSPDRCAVVLLGGGTPHKPPYRDDRGFVIHEATSCSNYLLQRGMAARHMMKEVSSYDTVGNAYFSLTIHAIPAGWRRIAVITSEFHMLRTAALFKDIFALAGQELYNDKNRFELSFIPVSDDGIFEPEVLGSRSAKEAEALATWRGTIPLLQTLPQLHAWLHQTHLCYAVARQGEFGVPTIQESKALSSY